MLYTNCFRGTSRNFPKLAKLLLHFNFFVSNTIGITRILVTCQPWQLLALHLLFFENIGPFLFVTTPKLLRHLWESFATMAFTSAFMPGTRPQFFGDCQLQRLFAFGLTIAALGSLLLPFYMAPRLYIAPPWFHQENKCNFNVRAARICRVCTFLGEDFRVRVDGPNMLVLVPLIYFQFKMLSAGRESLQKSWMDSPRQFA